MRIQERITVSVDWGTAAHGKHQVPLTITGPEGQPIIVTATVNVSVYCSPTLDFTGSGHLRYGLSFDGETPQITNLVRDNNQRTWEREVVDNVKIMVSQHRLSHSGWHTLKFWMVDPGIVLHKIVVDAGGQRPSYLGPPESFLLHDNTY